MATTPRPVWKGYLKLGAVSCGVKLVGATSEAGKIHFRVLNRKKATVDPVYFEKPYYLIPADAPANEAFMVIREALEKKKVAAFACIVLYQRTHHVLIEANGRGMTMTTLRNHNEVIAASSAFDGLKKVKVDKDMAEIATMIMDKKRTKFDPTKFEDTYEDALVAMIEAKRKGKKPPKAAPRPKENVVNLMDVLKKSLAKEGAQTPKKKSA